MLNNTLVNLQLNKLVHHCFFLILLVCALSGSLSAEPLPMITTAPEKSVSSSSAVKIINKTELFSYVKELQVQSQILAKDYFYISQGLREDKARIEIKKSAQDIDTILNVLTSNLKDEEMQNLLVYLNEVNLESKAILQKNYSEENASLVIDFSETIDEGAKSIIEYLSKGTKKKNTLHDDILQQKLILQRINKFYIAYQLGFNDETMFSKLAESVKDFQNGLNAFNTHDFVNEEQEFTSIRLKNYWTISKKFYEGMEKGDLTLIVSVSTDHLMSYLDKIISLEKSSKL